MEQILRLNEAIRRANEAGKLDDHGRVWVLQGMALNPMIIWDDEEEDDDSSSMRASAGVLYYSTPDDISLREHRLAYGPTLEAAIETALTRLAALMEKK